jgi:predicted aspartyl protease
LEFRDCLVYVSDRRSVLNSDGLLGMDVFSDFLVGLDYPMRKLALAPLPPRPGEEKDIAPSLNTDQAEGGQASSAVASQGTTSKPSAAAPPQRHDRYVAPEMKSYTSFYRNGHDILLPTQLNGKSVRLFLLDTGAFATTISPEAAREITKVHSDSSMTIHGLSGKVDKVYTGNKVIAKFANVRQEIDDIYAFDTSRLSKSVGMEISGFLGFTTLRLLTIHIDYRDGLVKFDYNEGRGYNHF